MAALLDGKLQFSLPGEPRFPALADYTILKPTLDWHIPRMPLKAGEEQAGHLHRALFVVMSCPLTGGGPAFPFDPAGARR